MPAILEATITQLRSLAEVHPDTERSDRFNATSCAALGVREPIGHHFVIDAVAWKIRDRLNKDGLPRVTAAGVVVHFFDKWGSVVAHYEDHQEPRLFAVAEMPSGMWFASDGLAKALPKFVAEHQPPLKRLYVVNVVDIIEQLYQRAEKLKFDLSGGSLFLPPTDSRYKKWMREAEQARERMQAKFDPVAHAMNAREPGSVWRRSAEGMTCPLRVQ
jgi:hypothetical protein